MQTDRQSNVNALLSMQDACNLAAVSTTTMRKWMEQKSIGYVSRNGKLFIQQETLEKHLENLSRAGLMAKCKSCGRIFIRKKNTVFMCRRCAGLNFYAKNGELQNHMRCCHDCGMPTWDYRCSRCLEKWRRKHKVRANQDE